MYIFFYRDNAPRGWSDGGFDGRVIYRCFVSSGVSRFLKETRNPQGNLGGKKCSGQHTMYISETTLGMPAFRIAF